MCVLTRLFTIVYTFALVTPWSRTHEHRKYRSHTADFRSRSLGSLIGCLYLVPCTNLWRSIDQKPPAGIAAVEEEVLVPMVDEVPPVRIPWQRFQEEGASASDLAMLHSGIFSNASMILAFGTEGLLYWLLGLKPIQLGPLRLSRYESQAVRRWKTAIVTRLLLVAAL